MSYDRSAEPRRFRADLNSRAVRIEDLRWTAALARRSRSRGDGLPRRGDRSSGLSIDRAIPTATPHRARANRRAATGSTPKVRLQVDRLSSAAWPVASALDLTARLADGVLAVAPVAFGIGSGRASGRFDLDTNRAPAQRNCASTCTT